MSHQKAAIKGCKGALYRAMRKHGIQNFVFEVIYTHTSKTHTKNIMEPKLIKEHNSLVPNGYNIAHGGSGGATRCGATLSEETKQKISNSVREYMDDPAVRTRMSKTRKQRVTKDSTREKLTATRQKSRWYSNHSLQQSIFRNQDQEEQLLDTGWIRGRLYSFNPRAWLH